MQKRRFAAALLTLLLLVQSISVSATVEQDGAAEVQSEEIVSGNFSYTMNADGTTAAITGFVGSGTSIIIPETIDGFTVTHIADYAFTPQYYAKMIQIPDTVEYIGDEAFAKCTKVSSFTIPDSVKEIGDRAFAQCYNLTDITIPESVEVIGDAPFYGCLEMMNTYVDADSQHFVSIDGVLYDKDVKRLIQYPLGAGYVNTEYIMPETVTTVGAYALAECESLMTITLSPVLETIEEYAFAYCCSWKNAVLPGTLTTIGESAFWGCSSIQKLTFPDSVTTIGSYQFYPESNLGYSVYTTDLPEAYFAGDVPENWGTLVFDPEVTTIYYPENGDYKWTTPVWKAPDGTEYNTVAYGKILGDSNLDNIIDAVDVKLLTQYFAGQATEIDQKTADVDNDGSVTRRDAMILARHLAKWEGYTLPYTAVQ